MKKINRNLVRQCRCFEFSNHLVVRNRLSYLLSFVHSVIGDKLLLNGTSWAYTSSKKQRHATLPHTVNNVPVADADGTYLKSFSKSENDNHSLFKSFAPFKSFSCLNQVRDVKLLACRSSARWLLAPSLIKPPVVH